MIFDSCSCDSGIIDLKASVSFTGTQFIITNNDSFDYVNAKLEVNDDFVLEDVAIFAGETYTVGMMQFANSDGDRFDFMKKPQKFSIWCDLENDKNGSLYATWK